jgi:hypothetical protein
MTGYYEQNDGNWGVHKYRYFIEWRGIKFSRTPRSRIIGRKSLTKILQATVDAPLKMSVHI